MNSYSQSHLCSTVSKSFLQTYRVVQTWSIKKISKIALSLPHINGIGGITFLSTIDLINVI